MRTIGFVARTEFSGLPQGIGCAGEVAVYLPMSYRGAVFAVLTLVIMGSCS